MTDKILVVEDSKMVLKVIRHVAKGLPEFECHYAESFSEAKKVIEEQNGGFFAALVDLTLPDAPDGEVVDYTLKLNINTIVLTASFDETRRSKLLGKGIVDYVTKEGKFSYEYAFNSIRRILANRAIKVLVVDDSETSLNFIRKLLVNHLFQVHTAKNGVEAVQALLENPDTELLISDYNMPRMNGAELVRNIRNKYGKSEMAIIGLSDNSEPTISASFIKNGANDFLRKPFNHEEFYCRVRHNVEAIENIKQIKESANRDYLTGLYNRHYFFDCGTEWHQQAKANSTQLIAIVLNLDDFREINDAHGFAAGDYVLQEFTSQLSDKLEQCLLARSSGDEFYILIQDMNIEEVTSLMLDVKDAVANTPLPLDDSNLYLSFSAGITNQLSSTLQSQLGIAASYLHRAKEAGKNLIIEDEVRDISG